MKTQTHTLGEGGGRWHENILLKAPIPHSPGPSDSQNKTKSSFVTRKVNFEYQITT